ncbi:hypothetical protein WCLP8_1430052 [uncultured Gammaproteobacteria bacterium]
MALWLGCDLVEKIVALSAHPTYVEVADLCTRQRQNRLLYHRSRRRVISSVGRAADS